MNKDVSAVRPSNHSLTVTCKGLTYTVKGHEILKDIHLCATPGRLTAVMGPSGCGKTTLLNGILQRLRKKHLKGDVFFNDTRASREIVRKYAHYVMAHDMFLPYLTVRETLRFQSRLRMPNSSELERSEAVTNVMEALELHSCQHTYVGGDWRKGISKGQTRRLAIAQELLGDPALLILDEPTTGLDSCLALELMAGLRQLARHHNKTIIASIHQPSQRGFGLVDDLVLLAGGLQLYHGPGDEALTYFGGLGRSPSANDLSHPDFLLELATSDTSTAGTETIVLEKQSMSPTYSTTDQLAMLHKAYTDNELSRVKVEISESRYKPLPPPSANKTSQSRLGQMGTIWKRSSINAFRNPMTAMVIVILNVLQALVLGGLFFQLTKEVKADVHRPVSQWPLWNNTIVQYLALGIDHDGTDPFLDVLLDGVDGSDGSLAFDFLTNQDVIDFLGRMLTCAREMWEEDVFKVEGYTYPPWYWPVGSVTGEEPKEEEPTNLFGVPHVEELLNSIMAAMQMIDYSLLKLPLKPFNGDPHDDQPSALFWNELLVQHGHMLSPILCCGATGYPIRPANEGRNPYTCADHYPTREIPKPPARFLGVLPDSVPWARDYSRESSSPRGLGNHFQRLLMGLKHLKLKPKAAAAATPKRRLGSSLGGLAEDLWSLIFDNQASPLYAMTQHLSGWMAKFRNCSLAYCESIVEYADWISDESALLASTGLAVLNIAGALFFAVANLGFASYDVLLQFPKERAVLNRELANGLYKTSSYMLAKMVADLPFQLAPTLLWSIIYYFMLGLGEKPWQFFMFLVVAFLVSLCAYSFGYLVSSVSPRLEVAVIFTPLILVCMLVLAGFFLRDADFPAWIGWFKYFSIYRWGFFGLCTTQFYPGGSFGSLDHDLILPLLGVVETRRWVSCVILLSLAAGFRFLTYFGLRFTNRNIGLEA